MPDPSDPLQRALIAGPPFDGVDAQGRTLLMRALLGSAKAADKKRLVSGFLKGGACVTPRDHDQASALDYAVFTASLPLIKLLVAKGADPNARDAHGRTALMKLNPASSKVYKVVPLLVELGADVNAQCDRGRTPMMYAALASDDLGMACYALQSVQARVDLVDNDGHDVIALCTERNPRMLRMLHRNLSEQTGQPNRMPDPGTPSIDGFLPPG